MNSKGDVLAMDNAVKGGGDQIVKCWGYCVVSMCVLGEWQKAPADKNAMKLKMNIT